MTTKEEIVFCFIMGGFLSKGEKPEKGHGKGQKGVR